MKRLSLDYFHWHLALYWVLLLFPISTYAHLEETINLLADRCRQTNSDAVLITRHGHVIFEYKSQYGDESFDIMSLTQSIASLAIAILQDEGRLSINQPVYLFLPEWNQGRKKEITIKHLLANTSGLQFNPDFSEILHATDIVQLALCADSAMKPGCSFYYNPKAVNVLAGIVEKATGKSLGEFLQNRLFTPLGIEQVTWLCDKTGSQLFHSHLSLKARDLVKMGEMLAKEGWHQGRPLISKTWIGLMTKPGQNINPFSGLLWDLKYFSASCWWEEELLKYYEQSGISPDFIKRLRCLCGRVIEMPGCFDQSKDCYHLNQQAIDALGGKQKAERFCQEVVKSHLPIANWSVGSLKSYEAISDSGQQLIIFPEKKIVAVRLICPRSYDTPIDKFSDFGELVEKLTHSMEP